MTTSVCLEDALQAAARIRGAVHRTSCVRQGTLSERMGRSVYLKYEHLQKTGSFKARGILNHIRALEPDLKARGVITISAGNAAQAVAWAAREAGTPATVVMPAGASPLKAEASRGYGAEVILHGTASEAFDLVFRLAEERHLHFVHPFDDDRVIAGHATVALEIAEDVPGTEAIVVPCGGGGLVSGVALGASGVLPDAAVWGVEPEGAPAMTRSLTEGGAVHLESWETIADGLAAPMAGERNVRVMREHGGRCLTVPDRDIAEAMRVLFDHTKQVVEPAGAAGVAALLGMRVPGDGPVVVVLSGGNVDRERYAAILSGRGDV